MSKYEITTIRSMDNEVRYAIYSHEEHGFFAGYDFMGSVNWERILKPECELTEEDDPAQIVRDLEAADDEFDQKVEAIIHDPAIWENLKNFMESIGCTDVKMTRL